MIITFVANNIFIKCRILLKESWDLDIYLYYIFSGRVYLNPRNSFSY